MIAYRSRRFRLGFALLGVVLLVVGFSFVGFQRATRITCHRDGDAMGGVCSIRRYGIVGAFEVDVPLGGIDELDVRRVRGSKGAVHAEVVLRMKRGIGHRDLEIETSSWIGLSPEIALEAREALTAFKEEPSASHLDLWLRRNVSSAIMVVLFALVAGVFGGTLLREQLCQLRGIRILVDHERDLVIVGAHQIAIRSIESIDVEVGRALYWSSGKNEHIPGYRLVLTRRGGARVPVTRELRAGNAAVHERARRDLLRAIGRPVD